MWVQITPLFGAPRKVCKCGCASGMNPVLPLRLAPPQISKAEIRGEQVLSRPLGRTRTRTEAELSSPLDPPHCAMGNVPPLCGGAAPRSPRPSLWGAAPCPPPWARAPYLVSAGRLLRRLQALIHTDDTNFGSFLGGKPVAPHEIHDHHVVLQPRAERFYLESPEHGCWRGAAREPVLTRCCRDSRVLHDPRNLVTGAREPGRHTSLCSMPVLSAAGGTWEAPRLRPPPGFPGSAAPGPHAPAAQRAGVGVELPGVTLTTHKKTSPGCCPWPGAPPRLLRPRQVLSDFKGPFLSAAGGARARSPPRTLRPAEMIDRTPYQGTGRTMAAFNNACVSVPGTRACSCDTKADLSPGEDK